MFDLCKFFGVSKNEVFQLKDIITNELSENDYRINDNTLQRSDRNMNKWDYCPFTLNAITNYDVIKLKQFTNEELTILNAIPTAEGAIQIAMEKSLKTVHGSKCLVLGFGRIGKILANATILSFQLIK